MGLVLLSVCDLLCAERVGLWDSPACTKCSVLCGSRVDKILKDDSCQNEILVEEQQTNLCGGIKAKQKGVVSCYSFYNCRTNKLIFKNPGNGFAWYGKCSHILGDCF